MIAMNLANATTNTPRRSLDSYPTPPDVTHALMLFLRDRGKLPGSVWEPACGDGAMSKVIKEYCPYVYSSDLQADCYGEGGIDFTKIQPHDMHSYGAVITNPPFNQSEQFIRTALQGPIHTVAMLLKSQYWHAAKRRKLFLKHPPYYVLPLTWRPDFLGGEKGGKPTMDCLWTVWSFGRFTTEYFPLEKPANFIQNSR